MWVTCSYIKASDAAVPRFIVNSSSSQYFSHDASELVRLLTDINNTDTACVATGIMKAYPILRKLLL